MKWPPHCHGGVKGTGSRKPASQSWIVQTLVKSRRLVGTRAGGISDAQLRSVGEKVYWGMAEKTRPKAERIQEHWNVMHGCKSTARMIG